MGRAQRNPRSRVFRKNFGPPPPGTPELAQEAARVRAIQEEELGAVLGPGGLLQSILQAIARRVEGKAFEGIDADVARSTACAAVIAGLQSFVQISCLPAGQRHARALVADLVGKIRFAERPEVHEAHKIVMPAGVRDPRDAQSSAAP